MLQSKSLRMAVQMNTLLGINTIVRRSRQHMLDKGIEADQVGCPAEKDYNKPKCLETMSSENTHKDNKLLSTDQKCEGTEL